MWIELRRQGEDSALHPVGFEFRVNVTSLCPCDWVVDYVWFVNLTFDNMQQLKHAYENDRNVTERLLQYELCFFTPHRTTFQSCKSRIFYLFEIKAKGQYWPLTCNTNHNTMFDMQEVSIKTNSNMYKPN